MSADPRCYSLELKNTKDKLKLTNLNIDIVISGFLAKTAVTMTFLNDTDHDGVEGELVFPMAEGSVLAGYAIDINGELVEGVVIEKEKARQVFETEARKEVSHKPTASIAEHVVGNVFKTRVFPIPKRGPRTIRVTTVEEVDAKNTFWLLLDFANQSIDNYGFSVQVDSYGSIAPRIWDGQATSSRDGRYMTPFEYTAKETKKSSDRSLTSSSLGSSSGSTDSDQEGRVRYRERFTASDPISPKGCIVYLPPSENIVIVEPDETKSEYYFVIGGQFSSMANAAAPVGSDFDVNTNRVGIVWDTSLSRMSHDKKVDLELVKMIATKLGRGAKIDIIPFSDAMGTPVTLTMTGNSSTDHSLLVTHLNTLNYDGGTNISSLKLTTGPTFEHTTDTYAYYCMFTDGMHNMSTKALPQVLEAPVYIFASSAEANTSLLKIVARKSGGEYFKLALSSASDELQRKVNSLGSPAFRFLGVHADTAVVQEVFPSIPTRVESVFRLSGKLKFEAIDSGKNTFVTLNFGFGAKITHSITCALKIGGSSYTSLIPRFWAQRKIDELTLFPEETENEAEILRLGRRFSIVTPTTSIIVLEELEQYVKHEIEPPAALSAIRTKWLAIMQERQNEKRAITEEKLVAVLSLWNRRVAWWNEDMASNEAKERNHLHCLPFGEGVDLMERTLSSQWIDWDKLHEVLESDQESDSMASSDGDRCWGFDEGSDEGSLDSSSDASGTSSESSSFSSSDSSSSSEEEERSKPMKPAKRQSFKTVPKPPTDKKEVSGTLKTLLGAIGGKKKDKDVKGKKMDEEVNVVQSLATSLNFELDSPTLFAGDASQELRRDIDAKKQQIQELIMKRKSQRESSSEERSRSAEKKEEFMEEKKEKEKEKKSEEISFARDEEPKMKKKKKPVASPRMSSVFDEAPMLQKATLSLGDFSLEAEEKETDSFMLQKADSRSRRSKLGSTKSASIELSDKAEALPEPVMKASKNFFFSKSAAPSPPVPSAPKRGPSPSMPPPQPSAASYSDLPPPPPPAASYSALPPPPPSFSSLPPPPPPGAAPPSYGAPPMAYPPMFQQMPYPSMAAPPMNYPSAPPQQMAFSSMAPPSYPLPTMAPSGPQAFSMPAPAPPKPIPSPSASAAPMARSSRAPTTTPTVASSSSRSSLLSSIQSSSSIRLEQAKDMKPAAKESAPDMLSILTGSLLSKRSALADELMDMDEDNDDWEENEGEELNSADHDQLFGAADDAAFAPSVADEPFDLAGISMPQMEAQPEMMLSYDRSFSMPSEEISSFSMPSEQMSSFNEYVHAELMMDEPTPIIAVEEKSRRRSISPPRKVAAPSKTVLPRKPSPSHAPPAAPSPVNRAKMDAPTSRGDMAKSSRGGSIAGRGRAAPALSRPATTTTPSLFSPIQSQGQTMPQQQQQQQQYQKQSMPTSVTTSLLTTTTGKAASRSSLSSISSTPTSSLTGFGAAGLRNGNISTAASGGTSIGFGLAAGPSGKAGSTFGGLPPASQRSESRVERHVQKKGLGRASGSAAGSAADGVSFSFDSNEQGEGAASTFSFLSSGESESYASDMPPPEPEKPSAFQLQQRAMESRMNSDIEQEELEMRKRQHLAGLASAARFHSAFVPSVPTVAWENLGSSATIPYRAPNVSVEYAFYEEIDESAPKEYSRDLTPAPEFPPIDWDAMKYASTTSGQSWKRWRERHKEQTWAEYEQKAFGAGDTFLDVFNRNRRLILQSRIQADFEAVEAENRKSRVLKSKDNKHDRYKVTVAKTTVASEEAWQLELELHTSPASAYKQYLQMRQRPELAKLTKFFIDAADYFFERLHDPVKAATILSNLAELELENPQFLRLIAFRLERAPQDPYLSVAINIYRKVLAIRSEEPQSHRDLAMALTRRALWLARDLEEKKRNPGSSFAENAKTSFSTSNTVSHTKKAMMLMSRPAYDRYALQEEKKVQAEIRALLVESITLLNDVVVKKWDVRFSQVEVVALMDLNRVVAIVRSLNLEHAIGLANLVDPRATALHMPVDLRIQIQWDTDMTDVELTVIEPSGEKCNSIHNKTQSGGMMSRDFTHGYGPVEYLARYAGNGHYSAAIKLFHALEMKSGTTVLVKIWTDYGKPASEQEYFFIGRLNKAKQSLEVADISVRNGVAFMKA